MLLAIDIGNSNIVCGIFDRELLKSQYRIETEKKQDLEHYKLVVKKGLSSRMGDIKQVVISSVVPELDVVFTKLSEELFFAQPLFVSTLLKTNISNLSEKDTQLGADRLCDIVAAVKLSRGNRIVVDMGTATKFEVVSDKNEYLGGAIAPGVGDSFKSLLNNASKLKSFRLEAPEKVVGGWNTQEHLNSGYIFGFASLIDGMIEKIKKEQKWKGCTVFLTGGFSDLISPHITHQIQINKNLTLEGLRLLWKLND